MMLTISSLSVCLSITLLNIKYCVHSCAMKELEYRKEFDAIGYERFLVVSIVFNFFRLWTAGDRIKCRIPKTAKFGVSRRQWVTE